MCKIWVAHKFGKVGRPHISDWKEICWQCFSRQDTTKTWNTTSNKVTWREKHEEQNHKKLIDIHESYIYTYRTTNCLVTVHFQEDPIIETATSSSCPLEHGLETNEHLTQLCHLCIRKSRCFNYPPQSISNNNNNIKLTPWTSSPSHISWESKGHLDILDNPQY